MKHLQIFVLLLVTSIQVRAHGNVETNNIDGGVDVVPNLRTFKYKDIWETVTRKIHDVEKLRDLAKRLKKLDKAEMEFKRQKEEGDPAYDPESVRIVDTMLADILHKYSVLENDEEWHNKPMHFEDVRLQKAWHLAVEEAEYSGSELRDLHTSFHKMQTRLGEYIWTLRQIENMKKKLNNETVNNELDYVTDNMVDGYEAEDDREDAVHSLEVKLKNEYGNIDEEVNVLTKKVKERIKADKLGEITDKRAAELLERAQTIMIDKDLEVFKSELDHFQNRISKLRHWERATASLKIQLEENSFEKELMEEYRYAKAKVKELQKFVKKYHTTLYNKLYKTDL